MTDGTSTTFEDVLIADMRAHDGAVTIGPLAGHPLLIMTSRGAKSGVPRRAILTWSRDGDDYVVAGTAGGSRKDPAWVQNIQAEPSVTIESENRIFEARATVADATARAGLWERHVSALPHFAGYPAQTGRLIPMVRITPVA